jgi:hypothetical protein
MAGENDGGKAAAAQLEAAGKDDAQAQGGNQAGESVGAQAKTDDGGNVVVNDGGASEGKHSADGEYQRAIKERDAKIAELETQVAKAAETKASAEKLTAEIAELKQQSADERVAYELRLAGARNVTAAKALLSEHDGDVSALKEAEPWLFESENKQAGKQSGTTGLEPAGATGKGDSTLKRWERIAGLTDDE